MIDENEKDIEENEDETTEEEEKTQEEEVVEEEEEEEEEEVEDRKQAIYDITPRGFKKVADQCVADGLSVDKAREKIREALAEKSQPVGTEEPEEVVEKVEVTARDING